MKARLLRFQVPPAARAVPTVRASHQASLQQRLTRLALLRPELVTVIEILVDDLLRDLETKGTPA